MTDGDFAIDVTAREVGAFFGRARGAGKPLVAERCPVCGQNGVKLRVFVRLKSAPLNGLDTVAVKGWANAIAHVIRTTHYEKIHVLQFRSRWRAPDALCRRLSRWLHWAVAQERQRGGPAVRWRVRADGTRREGNPGALGRLAARVQLSRQALQSLPRCSKQPTAETMAAIRAESAGWPDGPIEVAEWSAALCPELRRWPER